jgi:L-alanine-DL-glutamate epimerase-like enolase superfamily enzyme
MLDSTYSDQHTWPPFLNLDTVVSQPLIIKSVEMFRFRDVYLVRTTSTDGLVGIATTNARAQYLWPMFKGLVAPAFMGRDARELELLVNEVYSYKSNYKYHGTPFWNCVAYIEASLFDLLGKRVGKSVGDLLGGAWRSEIPIYLSSMRRDTTPEAEVDWVGFVKVPTGLGLGIEYDQAIWQEAELM